jgi:hypothetical protein
VDDPGVKRRHLFELEDQSWFPRLARDYATDYLQFIQVSVRLDRAIAPVFRRGLEEGKTTEVVDLCSGGSGPLVLLVKELANAGVPVHATLTDLFPNIPTFEAIARSSDGRITFEPAPVDARAVPAALRGLRTIFNGFHHFKPSDARSVLHAAAAAAQPIAIFEASDRRPINLLGVLLVPFAVWLMTPFIRPFRWPRLLLTYLLPLVPFTCLWDGIVSQLRAYTADEMVELGRGAPRMRWETGHIPIAKGRGRVTYLLGIPC